MPGPAQTATGRTVDPYDPQANSETFDCGGWVAGFDRRLLATSGGRQALTRLDPLLFAEVYMRKHLRDREGQISFADPHFEWVQLASRWAYTTAGLRTDRDAFVAPRATGKTTWWFLLIPMWAAAHGHARFAAAFADSGIQSELHLATFKRELSDNPLLRQDYPGLCEPARRYNGKTINDSQQMLYTKSGFAFAARGIDSTSLGLKIDEHRPDLIIFDDVEPPEATYSGYQKQKRLSTVQDAVLPLNEFARVVFVGTTTMPGSIVHELVQHGKGEQTAEWIDEEHFRTHHARPILLRDDGTERSIWPTKWPLEYLQSIRHTRSYAKNYDNDPMGIEGGYWTKDDFIYGRPGVATAQILSIDPTTTTKTTSDPAGLAVLSYIPANPPRVCVEDVWEVRAVGDALRQRVLQVLAEYPRVKLVMIEGNQGGENWRSILHHLPPGVKLLIFSNTIRKEVRAADLLDKYQHRRVTHAKPIPRLEEQMCAFPKAPHDDMVDAVEAGARRLLVRGSTMGTVYPH